LIIEASLPLSVSVVVHVPTRPPVPTETAVSVSPAAVMVTDPVAEFDCSFVGEVESAYVPV
jgi:hypothetical protein